MKLVPLVGATLLAACTATRASADWETPRRVELSGLSAITSVRLDVDSAGAVHLLVSAEAEAIGATPAWWTAAWRDSTWSSPRLLATGASGHAARMAGSRVEHELVWIARNPRDPAASALLHLPASGDDPRRPDTVLRTTDQASGLAGAVGAGRRWVARSQQLDPRTRGFRVRVATSRSPGRWGELPTLGTDEFACAVAALDSARALIVSAGAGGLTWAIATPERWQRQGILDDRAWVAQHPRLRGSLSGEAWLLWTEKERVRIARFGDGEWETPRALACAHPGGGTFWAGWCDISQDDHPFPALVWGERGNGTTLRDCLCAAIPDARGWPVVEEVPGSDGAVIPSIARTPRGDVWVAWTVARTREAFFTRWRAASR